MTSNDKTLRQILNYQLRRSSVQAMVLVKHKLNKYGLRRSTFAALSVIVDNPGMRQSQLADILFIDRPNIVKIIDTLEAADLVKRNPVQEDRRVHALKPTQLGMALCAEVTKALVEVDEILLKGLTHKEIEVFRKVSCIVEKNANSYFNS